MIIQDSTIFDQRTLTILLEQDPLVQRYRAFFALFDWSVVPEPPIGPSQPGRPAHPQTAYTKALLLKIEEGFATCTPLRRFLVEHPLLVLELGLRPELNRNLPYGFDVEKTVPTARGLRAKQHALAQPVLQRLLAATVRDLGEEIPGLGEVVAFDVTHIYAWVPRKQPARLCQGPLQARGATQRGSRLSAGGQERKQPGPSRAGAQESASWRCERSTGPCCAQAGQEAQGHQGRGQATTGQERRQRVPVGLWLGSGQRHRGRLWRRGARRAHPAVQ